MLFVITGILKPGAEQQLAALSIELNEFLSQPFKPMALAGVLRDRNGRKSGYLALLEADSFAEAERYLHESPVCKNSLYERTEVAEYVIEVGKLS